MAKMGGTYIWVAYKNVFGYISTNSRPFFMIKRPTIRGKCAWVKSNTWWDERPVFFGFSIFWQTSQLATEKIQNLCNRNRWSGLLQLGSVRFRSFFQSSELDLQTLSTGALFLMKTKTYDMINTIDSPICYGHQQPLLVQYHYWFWGAFLLGLNNAASETQPVVFFFFSKEFLTCTETVICKWWIFMKTLIHLPEYSLECSISY